MTDKARQHTPKPVKPETLCDLLSYTDAAKQVVPRVHRQAVAERVKTGRITPRVIGGKKFVTLRDVTKWNLERAEAIAAGLSPNLRAR